MNRLILVTGKPGIGKSTVVMKTIDLLRREGLMVGGMVTREALEGGQRSGFRIIDLLTNKEGWLAQVGASQGIRFGKYMVCTADLESVGVESIKNALGCSSVSVVVVDEIGPMELTSDSFREVIKKCRESEKILLATIHFSSKDPLLMQFRQALYAKTVIVTLENRNALPQSLSHMIINENHRHSLR